MTAYMICNLIGLSSTCTNPILYGYLNKNIQEVVMQSMSEFFDAVNVSFLKSSINRNKVKRDRRRYHCVESLKTDWLSIADTPEAGSRVNI